jgi:predicted amidohydrolase
VRVFLVQPSRWSPDGHANFDLVEKLFAEGWTQPGHGDLVVLPELVGSDLPPADYLTRVRDLALGLGAVVVGGSHYDRTRPGTVNRGVVIDAAGEQTAEYGKLHPYGVELRDGVVPGRLGGGFRVGGRRLRVLLCADLWYSASLTPGAGTDLLLVPAFSVTQWATPAPARALWQHMSVARAYEFMTTRARPATAGSSPACPARPSRRTGSTSPGSTGSASTARNATSSPHESPRDPAGAAPPYPGVPAGR